MVEAGKACYIEESRFSYGDQGTEKRECGLEVGCTVGVKGASVAFVD